MQERAQAIGKKHHIELLQSIVHQVLLRMLLNTELNSLSAMKSTIKNQGSNKRLAQGPAGS